MPSLYKRIKRILNEDWTIDAARKKHAPVNTSSSSTNHPFHDVLTKHGFTKTGDGPVPVYSYEHTHSKTGEKFNSAHIVVYPQGSYGVPLGITNHNKDGSMNSSSTNRFKDKEQLDRHLTHNPREFKSDGFDN